MKQPEINHVRICKVCDGEGEVMGAVMRIFCHQCHGHGFVARGDGESLSVTLLSKELHETRRKLAVALDRIERAPLSTGPDLARYENNERGPGKSHFTGD